MIARITHDEDFRWMADSLEIRLIPIGPSGYSETYKIYYEDRHKWAKDGGNWPIIKMEEIGLYKMTAGQEYYWPIDASVRTPLQGNPYMVSRGRRLDWPPSPIHGTTGGQRSDRQRRLRHRSQCTAAGTAPFRIAGTTGGWPASLRMLCASAESRKPTNSVASFASRAVPRTVAALRISSLIAASLPAPASFRSSNPRR